MKKILKCHCNKVQIELELEEKITSIKCNCSICLRRNAVMTVIDEKNLKLIKGKDWLKSYKFHTKVAEHFFCSKCGIYTHHKQRRDPSKYGINLSCIEILDDIKISDEKLLDGKNHPLDKND